jgi:hypothetical protein
MNWFWRVRIYNRAGDYWHGEIVTSRDLREIDIIQDFYKTLTGCKMLLEGMRETADGDIAPINASFLGLWNINGSFSPANGPKHD